MFGLFSSSVWNNIFGETIIITEWTLVLLSSLVQGSCHLTTVLGRWWWEWIWWSWLMYVPAYCVPGLVLASWSVLTHGNPITTPHHNILLSPFSMKEANAQRGQVSCPMPPSRKVVKLGLEPSLSSLALEPCSQSAPRTVMKDRYCDLFQGSTPGLPPWSYSSVTNAPTTSLICSLAWKGRTCV